MKTKMTVPITVVVKLASALVHADEMMSPKGHEFDKAALQQIIEDPEIKEFIASLGPLVPVKR